MNLVGDELWTNAQGICKYQQVETRKMLIFASSSSFFKCKLEKSKSF